MSSQTPRQATVDLVRTPEERFAAISDYPWTPQYAEVGSPGDDTCPGPLRMAYVDEGPRDAPVVLLLHGEPTWGYLYRHMVPVLLEAGLRVVVPDIAAYDAFYKRLIAKIEIRDVSSSFAMEQIKYTTQLPLDYIQLAKEKSESSS